MVKKLNGFLLTRKLNHKSLDCNWTRTQNHLVLKRTLNHLAKLESNKWLYLSKFKTFTQAPGFPIFEGCGGHHDCSLAALGKMNSLKVFFKDFAKIPVRL